jgi:diguanylate cyclase (GGDEF)-like protein
VTVRRVSGSGLIDQLQRSHQFVLGVLVSVLLLSVATSGYLILLSQPRLTAYVELAREARDAYEGMLDQETGLRAWLATDDGRFLQPYAAGRAHTDSAARELVAARQDNPEVADHVMSMLVTRQRWEVWATRAASTRYSVADRVNGTLTRFLLRGKGLFDVYRRAEARSTDQIKALRTKALARQRTALIAVLVSFVLLVGASAAWTIRRRRQLHMLIVRPVRSLRQTIAALRTGDLTVRTPATAVPELEEIGQALGALASELEAAQVAAAIREERLAVQARRLQTVVTVGREITGSLSVRYVSGTITSASTQLLGVPTALWLPREDDQFVVGGSSHVAGDVRPGPSAPSPLVEEAAASARKVTGARVSAYPLILAGRVTAVLEAVAVSVDPDTEQVLDALLSTAAAALESAHLHSTARAQADLDALTGLPNRRRFEGDIEAEWERCRRYGRPMSVVMLDLDHFKILNDEHGHVLGDEVLRNVGIAVSDVLRTTDVAFRYGGEEFVVLLQETGLEEAATAAERLRAAVARVSLSEYPGVTVTASVGVAARRSNMSHYTELVVQADRALYKAKRLGRNRVCAFGLPPRQRLVQPRGRPEVGDEAAQ